jgi:uncharacterized protein YndB with AHSA1/START domain
MRDLVVVRSFEAPVEAVWRAWSDPELVRRWWGPAGWTCPVAKMDFRVGGASLVAMRSPDGVDIYSTWAYTEIRPQEYFSYIFNLADEHGTTIDPVSIGMPPDFPREARHDVVLGPLDGGARTEMTMTEYGYTNDQLFELSRQGLEECLDKMAAIFAAGS